MEIPLAVEDFWESKKKWIIIILAIIIIPAIVLLALAIMLRTEEKPAPVVTVPVDPVTLTWWKPNLSGMQKSNYQKVIETFKNKNPNVTINFVTKPYSNDYYRDIIESLASGVGPDIFSLSNSDLPAYKNFVTPISLFQEQDSVTKLGRLGQYKNNFADLVVKDTILQDQVYGITSYVDNLQMYVNKDLLNQAQIAIPAQSWGDLDRQIPLLTKINSSGTSFDQSAISFGTGATANPVPNISRHQDILPLIIFQYGGLISDPVSPTTSVFGKQTTEKINPTLDAVKYFYSFADPASNRYTWSVNSPNNIEAFTSGKLAYIVHYSYFQDEIASRNPRLNYQVVPLPQIDQKNKKTYGIFFMDVLNKQLRDGMTSDLDKKANPQKYAKLYWSEQFLLYLSEFETQLALSASTGFPGARKDIIDMQLEGSLSSQVFAAGALYSQNYYKPDVERTEKIWSDLMYRIHFESNTTPKDALDSAIREYEKLVLEGPRKR